MSANDSSLSVVVATTLAELTPHAEAWNRLAHHAPQQLPMASYAWVSSFLEHSLEPPARWASFLAFRGATLVGTLTLACQQDDESTSPRVVLRTPRDDHTQIGDVLVGDDRPAEVVAALLEGALRHFPDFRYLEIKRFPASSPLLGVLQSRSLKRRWVMQEHGYGAYLTTPADFDSYRASLSRNFRNNLNKAANKFKALPGVTTRIEVVPELRESDYQVFLDMEASGWKGREGSAIASSPRLRQFYATLAARCADAGWLEWQFLHANGVAMAANLAMRMRDAVVIWKLGYNDAYSRHSPGSILLQELVKIEAQRGRCRVIDLTTDHAWYDNWNMERRMYYTVRVYQNSVGALLLGYLPARVRQRLAASPALRSLVHRLRSLRHRGGDRH
jgi:CelD/BcsL family acetyltransferase involved in cellulose biosynthesis